MKSTHISILLAVVIFVSLVVVGFAFPVLPEYVIAR